MDADDWDDWISGCPHRGIVSFSLLSRRFLGFLTDDRPKSLSPRASVIPLPLAISPAFTKSRPLPYKDELCLPRIHGVVSRRTRWLQRSTSEMLPVLKWHVASGTPCVGLASSPPTKYYTRTNLRTFAIPCFACPPFCKRRCPRIRPQRWRRSGFLLWRTRTEGYFHEPLYLVDVSKVSISIGEDLSYCAGEITTVRFVSACLLGLSWHLAAIGVFCLGNTSKARLYSKSSPLPKTMTDLVVREACSEYSVYALSYTPLSLPQCTNTPSDPGRVCYETF